MPCSVYRWQLRLRAHNTRFRPCPTRPPMRLGVEPEGPRWALGGQEVNGCWSRMEHSLVFQRRTVQTESTSCMLEPEDTAAGTGDDLEWPVAGGRSHRTAGMNGS